MISIINDIEPYQEFIASFAADRKYHDLFSGKKLLDRLRAATTNEEERVIGVFKEAKICGIFAWLFIAEERYVEMLHCLSRDPFAYDELFVYLQENYQDHQIDFVFNPDNDLLKRKLKAVNAGFECEQFKMVVERCASKIDSTDVKILSDEYRDQYIAMHNKDLYWTAEKVLERPDRFIVLIALKDDKVIAYLDLTYGQQENEPNDLFVAEGYRQQGYGSQLLNKALELCAGQKMVLLVDADNEAAIRLYESCGFVKAENENSLTVHYHIQ